MTKKETINTVGELIEFLRQNFKENDILSATYTEYGPNGSVKDIHNKYAEEDARSLAST